MKILGGETNLNAPISVGSASVVRVFNGDSSNLLVTRKTYGGTTVGTFIVPAGEVVYCEKDYTDTLEGSANLKVTQVAFSPMMSFVGQDSAGPTYTHSVSATAVDEGGNFTTTITTTNVADGTNLYWELTGVQSADFSSGALTGTASISSNSATFSHTVDEDLTTEGTETATIKVYSDSGRNTQVGNTLTVTISDTSTTPVGAFSVDFDGNDALSWDWNSSSMDWGSSESLTIEAFVKMDVIAGRTYHSIINRWTGSNYSFGLDIKNNGNLFFYFGSGAGSINTTESSGNTIAINRWYHIAVVKNGTTGTFYIDGQASGTFTWNLASSNSTQPLNVGNLNDGNSYPIDGKISDARVVIGTAVYTGNFTVPASPLTNISNTKFLACQSSTVTEATLVNNGSASDTASTVGDPASSNEDPFEGDHSVEFDGNDWLTMEDSTDFDLDSSDFTIECWYNPDTNPGWCGLMSQWPNGNYNVTNSWTFEPVGSTLSFYYCNTAGSFYNADATGSLQTNQWQHCAVTRSGNTINVWLNGSKGSDHTIVGTMQNSTVNVDIGGNVAGSGYVDGNISNLRLTKGQALYTSNFTPSTSALTTTSQGATASNVKFLGLNKSIIHMATVTPNPITIGGGDPTSSTSDPYT